MLFRWILRTVAVTALHTFVWTSVQAQQHAAVQTNSADRNVSFDREATTMAALGVASTAYIENRGQWPDEVRYLARIGGLNAWITDSGVVYDFYMVEGAEADGRLADRRGPETQNEGRRIGHVVQMQLVGGRAATTARPLGTQETYHNYFLGDDPSRWASRVPLHDEVTLVGVYEGVDARYYFDQGGVRYDFIVAPHADPGQMRLTFDGADNVRVAPDGALVLSTSLGEVRHEQLVAYQEVGRRRIEVPVAFRVSGNEVHFEVGAYDTSQTLVIDPLVYATFLASSNTDRARGIGVDASGAAHVAGETVGNNFPTTTGAYDETHNGNFDAFLTKLSPDGSDLLYSTYIGGLTSDNAYGLVVDASGVYVTGITVSGNFPTTPGAFRTTPDCCGLGLGFLTKFSLDGSALVYSTFLWRGDVTALAVDLSGAAYVAGYATTGTDFPATPGAFQTTHSGFNQDAFIAKLSPTGSTLVYGSFLGGSGPFDQVFTIAVDAAGAAHVAGYTWSTNFPTTGGAFRTTHNGGLEDGFVTKFAPDGGSLLFSTYVGGSEGDRVHALTLDNDGNVYAAGRTGSPNFPTTPGAFRTSYAGGNSDVFVTKFVPDGSALVYSTFIGGSDNDQAHALAVDGSGAAYVAGETFSTNFPATAGAFQTARGGQQDAFVAKLSPDGGDLFYATYLGGSLLDRAAGLALDPVGSAYVAGETQSGNFPVTPGAFETGFSGPTAAFVAKLIVGDVDPESYVHQIGAKDEGPGWHMLSSLTLDATVQDLANANLVYGIPGEYPNTDGTNPYVGYDGETFTAPSGLNHPLAPGKGFIWYLWDTIHENGHTPAGSGISEHQQLPFDLTFTGSPVVENHQVIFTEVERAAEDDGWYLIGNPYTEPYDVSGITPSTGGYSATFHHWDAVEDAYVQLNGLNGDEAPVLAGFFMQFGHQPSLPLTITFGPPASGPPEPPGDAVQQFTARFELSGELVVVYEGDEYPMEVSDRNARVIFAEDGTDGFDVYDAGKLNPLSYYWANVALMGMQGDEMMRRAVESRPLPQGPVIIPMALSTYANGLDAGGSFTISLAENDLGAGWQVALIDLETSQVTNLLTDSYTFTVESQPAIDADQRFEITFTPPTVSGEAGGETYVFGLEAVWPNPTISTAQVGFTLETAGKISLEVFDVLGRRVAHIANGEYSAGRHVLPMNANVLASGVYVVRLTAGSQTAAQRVTVAR